MSAATEPNGGTWLDSEDGNFHVRVHWRDCAPAPMVGPSFDRAQSKGACGSIDSEVNAMIVTLARTTWRGTNCSSYRMLQAIGLARDAVKRCGHQVQLVLGRQILNVFDDAL